MIVKKNLKSISDTVLELYKNFELAKCNDSSLRMSVNNGAYDWHSHDNSEELFIVLEGRLFIDIDMNKTYTLNPHDFLKIPKGILHRTRSTERTVNLTFEKRDTKTIFLPFDQKRVKKNDWKIQNIKSIGQGITEDYKNFELELINDHVMRLGVNTGTYDQHYHPNSDELFIGIDGEMVLKSENEYYSLQSGEMLSVPKDTLHSTMAKERKVSLSFSKNKTETIFV